jgi:nitrite reductase/ring-hydroxylating ferredoxin subunit
MLINLSALALFAVAWWVRGGRAATPSAPGTTVLLLELAGLGLLLAGGWLGGTLAYANQIGVNNRYANAGRWREVTIAAADGQPVTVGSSDELELDQLKLLRIGGRRVVLGRTADGYVVFDDRCTHKGGSLADGVLICGTVQCPWHGSQFDVTSGKVKAGPATAGIETYRVEEADGELRLTL